MQAFSCLAGVLLAFEEEVCWILLLHYEKIIAPWLCCGTNESVVTSFIIANDIWLIA
jgi:hypothetical protein